MRRILTALALLCAIASPIAAQPKCTPGDFAPLTGQAGAIDGDTLALMFDGRRTPNVRLWGVDSPELLAELVHSKPVTVRPVECDKYGRTVAHAEAGGEDLSLAMVRAGMAYTFTHYAMRADMIDRYRALADAEREARKAKRGLWVRWMP